MTRDDFEDLWSCQPSLERLARRLLRDEHRAHDAVQEAWLLALRNGPPVVRPGWLAGVVRNVVRRLHRDDERRRRREQRAAQDECVFPETPGEEDLRRRLARLVLALPPRYREPILLRYYHALEPAEIAVRLRTNPSTVRTRLQRALRRLRRDLDAEYGLAVIGLAPRGARRWGRWPAVAGAAAVLLVAVVSGGVERGPPPRAPAALAEHRWPAGAASARPADVHAPAAAVRTMTSEAPRLLTGRVELFPGASTPTVSVAVACGGRTQTAAVDDTFLFALDGSGPIEVTATHPEAQDLHLRVHDPGRVLVLRLRRRALVAAADPGTPAVGEGAARGEAPDLPADAIDAAMPTGGTPLALARLEGIVHLPEGVEPVVVRLQVARARFDVAPGRPFSVPVRFEGALPGTLRVSARHPGTMPSRVDAGVHPGPRVERVEIRLERARSLRGVVALEGEGPGEGVTLAAYALRDGVPDEDPETTSLADDDGSFDLAVAEGRPYDVVAAAPGWRPAAARAGGGELRLVLSRGAAVTGSAPVAARLRAARTAAAERTSHLGDELLTWENGRVSWQARATQADADGRYVLGGLETEEHEIACDDATQPVFPPAEVDFEAPPTRLEVIVRASGAPLPGARVLVATLAAETDAAGHASFELASAPPYAVTVEAAGLAPQERLVRPPRAEFDLRPPGELATLSLRLDARGGAPLPVTCTVLLVPPFGPAVERSVGMEAAAPGLFLVRDLEPGPYTVDARPGGWYFPAAGPAFLRAGEATGLTLAVQAGGRIRIDCFDPAGRPAPAWVLIENGPPVVPHLVAPSASWSEFLAPGAYSCLVLPADASLDLAALSFTVEAGQARSLPATFTSPPSRAPGAVAPGIDLKFAPQVAE